MRISDWSSDLCSSDLYNGSEKFSGTKRYGFFPSLGAAWLVSNEAFWPEQMNFISSLKFRATWGRVGNDAIAERADRFFYLSDISLGGGAYRWGSSFMNAYDGYRSEEHTSELQSLMRNSYA